MCVYVYVCVCVYADLLISCVCVLCLCMMLCLYVCRVCDVKFNCESMFDIPLTTSQRWTLVSMQCHIDHRSYSLIP